MARRVVQNLEQFGQLPMFVQAKTLMHDYHHGDSAVHHYDVMPEKLEESIRYGYRDSIAEEGVRTPVSLWHEKTGKDRTIFTKMPLGDTVINGHHRVAAAYDINPESEIPVMHTSKIRDTHDWKETGSLGDSRARAAEQGTSAAAWDQTLREGNRE